MSAAQIICLVLACLSLVSTGMTLEKDSLSKVIANLIFTGIFAYGAFA